MKLKPRPLNKKNGLFWSNPYEIEIMMPSLIEVLELKIWSHENFDNIF